MDGTRSGFCLRFSILSSSAACDSLTGYSLRVEIDSLDLLDVSGVCAQGFKDSRFLQRMYAYRRGMPIGYTCNGCESRV